jgi:hypothetical protein
LEGKSEGTGRITTDAGNQDAGRFVETHLSVFSVCPQGADQDPRLLCGQPWYFFAKTPSAGLCWLQKYVF